MATLRMIVNGALLTQCNGKNVSITGCITQIASSGLSFEMQSVDDQNIRVNLKKPYDGLMKGYVEVNGVAQGKSINCDEIIRFSPEESADFDIKAHNTLCKFLHSIPNIYS